MLLRWFEYSQVYQPDRTFRHQAQELHRPFEELSVRTGDNVQVHGWFFPSDTGTNSYVTLVCHGNAGNIGDRLDVAQELLASGTAVLLFDYRGYGKSGGRPSEDGTYQDALACYRWLINKGFPASRIIAHGESLGGGVASGLASRAQVAALILQSTYTSVPELGAELFPWLPVRLLSTIKYDTHSRLPALRVPVLIMHSREDSLIPFRHAQTNFAAANEPKLFWELKGDHNDGVDEGSGFKEGITRFLSMLNERRL